MGLAGGENGRRGARGNSLGGLATASDMSGMGGARRPSGFLMAALAMRRDAIEGERARLAWEWSATIGQLGQLASRREFGLC